jgi:hypothetical protein
MHHHPPGSKGRAGATASTSAASATTGAGKAAASDDFSQQPELPVRRVGMSTSCTDHLADEGFAARLSVQPRDEAHEDGSGNAWREGDLVMLPREQGDLPDRCVICNGPTDYYRHIREVRVIPWWAMAAMLAGGPASVGLVLLLCPAFTVEVGLCEKHRRRMGVGTAVKWGGLLVGAASFVAGSWASSLLWLTIGPVVALFALLVGEKIGCVVRAPSFDDRNLHLRVGKAFLESLPSRPRG